MKNSFYFYGLTKYRILNSKFGSLVLGARDAVIKNVPSFVALNFEFANK